MPADEMRCGRPGECQNENMGPVSMQRRGRSTSKYSGFEAVAARLQRVVARTAR
jgi:hypothetical protein